MVRICGLYRQRDPRVSTFSGRDARGWPDRLFTSGRFYCCSIGVAVGTIRSYLRQQPPPCVSATISIVSCTKGHRGQQVAQETMIDWGLVWAALFSLRPPLVTKVAGAWLDKKNVPSSTGQDHSRSRRLPGDPHSLGLFW
jgi:hypothetical protein